MMNITQIQEIATQLRDRSDPLSIKAADAIDSLLREWAKKTIEVETPLGTLVAHESGWGEEYPGFFIDLRREINGRPVDCSLALVEYTSTEADVEDKGILVTRAYSADKRQDARQYPDDPDAPSHRVIHSEDLINEFFAR